MSLLDTLKGLVGKGDVMEQIKNLADSENTGKLAKLVTEKNPTEVRIAAIDALKNIKMDELAVNTLMGLLNDGNKEVVLTAINSLKKIGTKREVNELQHKVDTADDDEIKKALLDAVVECKDRTPRF